MKWKLLIITSHTCGACVNLKKAGHIDDLKTRVAKDLPNIEIEEIILAKNGDKLTPSQLNTYCGWYPIFMLFREDDWTRMSREDTYYPEVSIFNGLIDKIDGKVRVKPAQAEARQTQTAENIFNWCKTNTASTGFVSKSPTAGNFFAIKPGDEILSVCSKRTYIAKNRIPK